MDLKQFEKDLSNQPPLEQDHKKIYHLLWFMDLYRELEAVRETSPLFSSPYLVGLVVKNFILTDEKFDLREFGEPEEKFTLEQLSWALNYNQTALNKLKRTNSFSGHDYANKTISWSYLLLNKANLEIKLSEKDAENEKTWLADAYSNLGHAALKIQPFKELEAGKRYHLQAEIAGDLGKLTWDEEKRLSWYQKSCRANLKSLELTPKTNPGYGIAAQEVFWLAYEIFKGTEDAFIKENAEAMLKTGREQMGAYYFATNESGYWKKIEVADGFLSRKEKHPNHAKGLKKKEKVKAERWLADQKEQF